MAGGTARRRGAGGRDALDRLREICLALPEAQEKLSHGEPTWFAGKGKVFAMLDDHHHGAAKVAWLVEQAYRLVAHPKLVAKLG